MDNATVTADAYSGYAGHGKAAVNIVNWDAQTYNAIYGSSETVTPLSMSCKFYISY